MHVQASVHTRAHTHTHKQFYKNSNLPFQILGFPEQYKQARLRKRGETVVAKIKEFSIQNLFFFKLKIVPRGKTSAIDNNALKSNIHSTIFIQTHINNLSKKNLHTKTVCGSLHPSLAQTKKHYLYLTDTIFHMKALEIIELPKPFFFSRDAIYLI